MFESGAADDPCAPRVLDYPWIPMEITSADDMQNYFKFANTLSEQERNHDIQKRIYKRRCGAE